MIAALQVYMQRCVGKHLVSGGIHAEECSIRAEATILDNATHILRAREDANGNVAFV